jgi:hypothetical protein
MSAKVPFKLAPLNIESGVSSVRVGPLQGLPPRQSITFTTIEGHHFMISLLEHQADEVREGLKRG